MIKIMIDNMNAEGTSVNAAVGVSEKWDAREAGIEVARSTVKKLKHPPDLFLLFSTIHYRDHGGFEEFISGVKSILPESTPIVGGTVAGFMNNYGNYIKGASALAVSYPNMDVVIGVGNNTKRNPKKAARQCSNMIKNGFSNSTFKNKFLLSLVSGPLVMKIPGQGYKKIIDSGFMSKFIMFSYGLSQYFFQKGLGREDEIFEYLTNNLPEYNMVLGTSVDDYKGIDNFQFYNDKILTNSLLGLGISTDLDLGVNTSHGMTETDIKFEISKLSKDKHIIKKINNKPPVEELYRLLNWPEGFLNEEAMLDRILYYPISLKRQGRKVPAVMLFIFKDSILTPCVNDEGEVSIMNVSGRGLIESVKDNIRYFENIQPEFGLSSTCLTILQTLGYKSELVHQEFLKYFKNKPFLVFWNAGEGTYSPKNGIIYANMSYNTAVFGRDISKSQ